MLVCGDCGASYRRRTERGKVVWRCATRVEKGKEACSNSPTIDEEWIKKKLAHTMCVGFYNEIIIKEKIEWINIYPKGVFIKGKYGEAWKINF